MISYTQLKAARETRAKKLGLSVEELDDQVAKYMEYIASMHTPICISIFDVVRILDGEDVLSEEGWLHVTSCEYCQKLIPDKGTFAS